MELPPLDYNIATALNCPPSRKGYLLAVREMVRSIRAAQKFFPDKVSFDFIRALDDHMDQLSLAADEDQALLTTDSFAQKRPLYGQLLHSKRTNLPSTNLEKVDAAMGLVLAHHICMCRPAPVATVLAWRRLQACGTPRNGRHVHWQMLANDFPMDMAGLQSWNQRAEEKDMVVFLKSLEIAWGAELAIPSAKSTKDASASDKTLNTSGNGASGSANTDSNDGDSEEQDECSAIEKPDSFVGWLVKRSIQSGYLFHLGLENLWDKQTTDETKFVCKAIHTAFKGSLVEQGFALFAVASFSTSLPPQLLVHVGLKPNTDLWIDFFTKGCAHWCLDRYLDADHVKSMEPHEIDLEHVVEIYFPQVAHHVAQSFAKINPNATNVIEFIIDKCDAASIVAFLEGYRAWLRSLGSQSLHGVYGSRFGRSGGQFYRQLGNDVLAAFLSLDFDECAMGMLHYTRFPREFLHGKTDQVLQLVGLGPAVAPERLTGFVGPAGAMEIDEFLDGIAQLYMHRKKALSAMLCTTSKQAQVVLDAFNVVVHCDLLLMLSLTGGRDNHLDRLTWGSLMAHQTAALLRDKDIEEYTDTRAAPIHKALRIVLDGHAEAKNLFTERIEAQGVKPHSPRGQQFNEPNLHRTFFEPAEVITVAGIEYLQPIAVDAKTLKSLSEQCLNGYINVGRHTLISHYASTWIDPFLLKALSGHYRGHAETFDDGMGIAPVVAIEELSKLLDHTFAPLTPTLDTAAANSVFDIQKFSGRLPSPVSDPVRRNDSRARVLPPPFDSYTLLAIRVKDHLASLLNTGQGPRHPGANLLLNLMIQNGIPQKDLQIIWELKAPFFEASDRCAMAMWNRPNCRAEIHIPLVLSSVIALGDHKATRGLQMGYFWATNKKGPPK